MDLVSRGVFLGSLRLFSFCHLLCARQTSASTRPPLFVGSRTAHPGVHKSVEIIKKGKYRSTNARVEYRNLAS
ncbi:hypothetical protein C8R47DRAFT_210021 [Mycena vitilis]|nr:hypothetical protein C8R47DRAFT_210021 [Mycena vitilis]